MADQSELVLYETMFQKRFTEEDSGFRSYLEKPAQPPPIVDSWSSHSRRNFNVRSQTGGRTDSWRGRGGGTAGDHRGRYHGYSRNSGGYGYYQGGYDRHQRQRPYQDRPYH